MKDAGYVLRRERKLLTQLDGDYKTYMFISKPEINGILVGAYLYTKSYHKTGKGVHIPKS